jgi:hypothetical protein
MADDLLLFVKNRSELLHYLRMAIENLIPGGIFWTAYPKMSSGVMTDINRDQGWDPLIKLGFGPVASISIDETWTALRWRPEKVVKRKPDSTFTKKFSK